MPGTSPRLWGVGLGVALGGFFDGIVLHQILQWHHLLSLVPSVGTLRAQVLWDGVFHLLLYVLAVAALWGLWRTRGTGGPLAAPVLMGFGLWHAIDAVLSHWLLGLHRIRVDSENPLAWDLGWLAAFGLLPLALGAGMRRRGGGGGPATLAMLTLLAVGAGAWALRPPATPFTAVVFRPGVGTAEVVAALVAADARLVGGDPGRGVIVVDAAPAARWRFYAHGALLVGGAGLPAGCVGWSRA